MLRRYTGKAERSGPMAPGEPRRTGWPRVGSGRWRRGHPEAVRAFALAAIGALLGCTGDDPGPRNLVLVVIDTLRADRVGVYGADRATTPAIDSFARDAVRFERAYSSAPWTQPAMASIFTAVHPSGHGLVHLGGRIPSPLPTLPEVLQRQGFATGAVVSHVLVGRRYGFARGFDSFDETESGGHEAISTPGVTKRAIAMLDDLARNGQRFFLLVHYFDPHYSYHHHEEIGFAAPRVGRIQGGEPIEFLRWIQQRMTPEELSHLRALYDEEVRFTDDGLNRLLAALEQTGRMQDTVIVVTSDHGEEFLERTRIGHAASVYEELIRVPLIVRTPGVAGRVVEWPASTAALAPTLLEILGLSGSELRATTASFAPLMLGKTEEGAPLVFSETQWFAQKRAAVGVRYKLIRDQATGNVELYDLVDDREELRDLSSERLELVRPLAKALDDHIARQRSLSGPPTPPELDPEQREMLRGLGYLEAPRSSPAP